MAVLLFLQLPHEETQGSVEPPVCVRSEAALLVLRSVARFLSAYFSRCPVALRVFPPHCPRVLPPLHLQHSLGEFRISTIG